MWLARAVFEVDASLKWTPWQSKLKSSTCITKRENSTVSNYTAFFQRGEKDNKGRTEVQELWENHKRYNKHIARIYEREERYKETEEISEANHRPRNLI